MALIDLSASIEMTTCSDPGRVRDNNEDSVLANAPLGLAVLADGMGGYNAGEVASSMATTVLGCELEQLFADNPPHHPGEDGHAWVLSALAAKVSQTNRAIYQAALDNPKYAGMGTTLVMVQFYDNRMAVAHVGDSRLYRVRDGELMQITRDHSLLQDQLDSGLITPEEARYSHNKNLVTRALGVEEDVKTDVAEHAVLPGDVYLLCSDGLNDMVDDEDIALTLSSLSANLPLCAQQLIDLANDNGGRDNVSVVLVKIRMAFPAPDSRSGWKNKLQSWFG